MNEEIRKTVLSMTLMSDILFNAFMNNNKESMQYVLRIIMNKKDLKVEKIETQQTVPALFSRGVRFDVFATDSKKNEYNFEVQQTAGGAKPENETVKGFRRGDEQNVQGSRKIYKKSYK